MKWYKIGVLLLACTLTVSSVFPVHATDSIDSLEETTSNLQSELDGINAELNTLSLEISEITSQIAQASAELSAAKEELARSKGEEAKQYEAMKLRIKYMYENGNHTFLETLFSSASLAEFINRAEMYASITEYDRQLLKELNETSSQIAQKELALQQNQEDLYALQASLSEKEASLYAKAASAAADLSKYTAQLDAAREEAQKAQQALDQEVLPIPPVEEVTPDEPVFEVPSEPETETPSEPEVETPSEPEETPKEDFASVSDVELLAALIECEAGSTNYEGMLAVGSVVVNRMNHRSYPNTLRGVIYQSGQFTPALNGKVDRVLARGVKSSCVTAARDALSGKNNVGDCLSFRAASSGHAGVIIGDNVFF